MIIPFINGYKLSRANEMLLGVLLPLALMVYEVFKRKRTTSKDYDSYLLYKTAKKMQLLQ
ncbi:hypothetical protein LWM68_19050 [Niabella sp. W65]|nr:hypothetical protein [Niabella sp. W65]MCH7364670.1 hypothetical protein [Niabella sp. W65]